MRNVFFLLPALFLLGAGCNAVPFQTRDVATCSYDGTTYRAGDSFKSSDGCNTCSCSENGQVACTLRACAPIEQPAPAQCQNAADCKSQNLDAPLCDNGQWACVKNMCELQCGVSSKL